MSKKKNEDTPPPGSPAWMSTYGDMMTLLLCFFVLLFSMSTVDKEKFEMIAASFSQTFSIFSQGASAIGDGVLVSNGVSQLNELDDYINSMGKVAEGETLDEEILNDAEAEQLAASEELAEKVEEALEEQNMSGEVNVDFTSQYVMLTLNGALLFESGSSDLREEAVPVLSRVATILERYQESIIEVEGHTDNVPIHNSVFANNDELSSFRALEVFYFLVEKTNIDPSMIKHSGRGEYLPIADNSTEAGRSMNRRVEIKLYNSLGTY